VQPVDLYCLAQLFEFFTSQDGRNNTLSPPPPPSFIPGGDEGFFFFLGPCVCLLEVFFFLTWVEKEKRDAKSGREKRRRRFQAFCFEVNEGQGE